MNCAIAIHLGSYYISNRLRYRNYNRLLFEDPANVELSTMETQVMNQDGDAKTVTIIVNGRPKTVPKNEELSFDAVVALAFPNPPTGNGVQFTVQFTR